MTSIEEWNDEPNYGEDFDSEFYKHRPDPASYTVPARPGPPSKPETKTIPPDVIVLERNNALVHALQMAPAVLYTRFREFGQLGVLGWCDELRELIDEIIKAGFEGALFTSTREAALGCCSRILRTNMDVNMQIIIIYLSSQVARLRRFLDGDLQYEDYPDLSFPREAK